MKTNSILCLTYLILAIFAHAESAENLFRNAEFSDGFAHWIGYQGGPDGNKHTDPDRFAEVSNGEVTITPFTPTGHMLNFYQGFGQRGNLNPPLTPGTTYQFEVDFAVSTAKKAKLSVIVYFYDAAYKNIKRASLPLIQTPGKTTSVQFTVPEEVAIVHVGVGSQGLGKWPGNDFDGSYTVKNFVLTEVPSKN